MRRRIRLLDRPPVTEAVPPPVLSPIKPASRDAAIPDGRVTVVMITHNRGPHIHTALQHLLELAERPRVIVVDNGSQDETVDFIRSMRAGIEVVPIGHNLGAAGRNIGVASCGTPYVAFSDDDSWWAPGALRAAADAFDSNPSLGLVAGRILVGPEHQLDPLCRAMTASPLAKEARGTPGVPVTGFAACGAIVRRRAFLQTGGFERRLGVGGEEQVVSLQLLRHGWKMLYLDQVVAYHFPSRDHNDPDYHARMVRNAIWSAWLRRPAASALTLTWRLVQSSLKDPSGRRGLLEAVRGLSWVIARRDPVPAWVDEHVKKSEQILHGSTFLH